MMFKIKLRKNNFSNIFRKIIAGICLTAASGLNAGQDIFSPEIKSGYSTYGNVSMTKTDNNGNHCLLIQLGGVNSDKSGALQMSGKQLSAASPEFNSIAIEMKGDGGTGKFVLIIVDSDQNNWCWRGKRWEDSAMISCLNDAWHRKVFYFKDFIYIGKKTKVPELIPSKIQKVQLAIGREITEPERCQGRFFLYRAAYEKDAIEDDMQELNKNVKKTAEKQTTELVKPESSTASPEPVSLNSYKLPSWVNWDLASSYKVNMGPREYIYLNNYWQFQPVLSANIPDIIKNDGRYPAIPDKPKLDGEWYYTKVPGSWDNSSRIIVYDAGKKEIDSIYGRPRSDYVQGWLRRNFTLPADWKGRKIILELKSVSEESRVFINGVNAGDISKTGKLDITGYVFPGSQNDISVFVRYVSCPMQKSHDDYKLFIKEGMGGKWWFSKSGGPGLAGDVIIKALPGKVVLDDLQIVTSISAGNRLSAFVNVSNNSSDDVEVKVGAEAGDKAKKVFEIPGENIIIKAKETRRLEISAQWKDVKYWSPDDPAMYTLRLKLEDGKGNVIDELDDFFGFREISIGDGDFQLNGRKTRLVFMSAGIRSNQYSTEELTRLLKFLKSMNFNGIIHHASLDERVVRLCNELGVMVIMRASFPGLVRNGIYLPGVTNQGFPYELYLSTSYSAAKLEFEDNIKEIIRKFRNDPSIICWTINPLLLWDTEWINPNLLTESRPHTEIAEASTREEQFINKFDPSRLVTQSMGSTHGRVIAANPYPTFSNNPDEWADWPVKWSTNKWKPLMLEEVALPFSMNFGTWYNSVTKKRAYYWDDYHQAFYEHAARYFGDAVYCNSRVDIPDSGFRDMAEHTVTLKDGTEAPVINQAALETCALWLERCLRAWRIYDISGIGPFEGSKLYFSFRQNSNKRVNNTEDVSSPGIKLDYSVVNDYSVENQITQHTKKAFAPFLGYIGGRPERFSSQEHNYYSGDNVSKQMLLSNDSQKQYQVKAGWKIIRKDNGREIASGRWQGEMSAGDVKKVPFSWKAENVNEKTEYKIIFDADTGENNCRDEFLISVFPEHKANKFAKTVLLYDEKGKTEELLKDAGVPYRKDFGAADVNGSTVLIVGRESFTATFIKLCRELDLENALKKGATVLIMQQTADSPMKNYLEERRSRHVFIKNAGHPVLENLKNADMQYWRGESDMLEAYPDSRTSVNGGGDRFMRWGTEGIVSSFVMDKPYSGRFRVLLECDFDLSRTPLLEYFAGSGRMLFCQLDLDSRYGKDPAATILADNIFSYVSTQKPVDNHATGYSGNQATEKIIKDLDFTVGNVSSAADLKQFKQLIVSGDSKLDYPAILSFAENGGTVLFLNADKMLIHAAAPDLKPVREKVRLARFAESKLVNMPGNSDLYFNPSVELNTFGNAHLFAERKIGKGRYLFLNLSPDNFKQNGSVLKAKRLLSMVFTDLELPSGFMFNLNNPDNAGELTGRLAAFSTDPDMKGESSGWAAPGFDDRKWLRLKLGDNWEGQGITMNNPGTGKKVEVPYDGDAWYRIRVNIPESWKGRELYFTADAIDDLDWCYFNGALIGHTGENTPKYWSAPRSYKLPPDKIIYGGENLIAVKVRDLRGYGGILGHVGIGDNNKQKTAPMFYEPGSRLFYTFDPNTWRQW